MTVRLTFAWLRFLLARHGWPAAAGVALMASAALLQLAATQELHARARHTREAQAALRTQLAARPQAAPDGERRLAALSAVLPQAAGTGAAIETLHLVAGRHGVGLAQGEYRLLREAGAPLARYQITLPARAGYPQLRAWLADVLNDMPALALEEIALHREDAGAAQIEARLRLTLYVRTD